MKPQELRIGNWVQVQPLNIPSEGIYSNTFIQITSRGISAIHSGDMIAKPIPFTEEWLEKFGFKIVNDISKQTNIESRIVMREFSVVIDSFWHNERESWIPVFPIIVIQYVHQLQNLYYALTGEEL